MCPVPAPKTLQWINSTLMQNYWDEKPVTATSDVKVLIDANGAPYGFSTGNGGSIFSYQPASPGSADWEQLPTGLTAKGSDQWAVAVDVNNTPTVFVVGAAAIRWVAWDATQKAWSAPKATPVTAQGSAPLVAIRARNDGAQLVVVVFATAASFGTSGPPYDAWYGAWAAGAVSGLAKLPFTVDSFSVTPGTGPTGTKGLLVLHTPQIYTKSFPLNPTAIYDDGGSGTPDDLYAYSPATTGAWCSVGDCALDGSSKVTTTHMLGVQSVESPLPGSAPLLVPPSSWVEVWNDKGSGARADGSFWQPSYTSKNGHTYLPLGYSAADNNTKVAPVEPALRLVRSDLTVAATLMSAGATNEKSNTQNIYMNNGSLHSPTPVSVDLVLPATPGSGLIAGTCASHADWKLPSASVTASVACLAKKPTLPTSLVFFDPKNTASPVMSPTGATAKQAVSASAVDVGGATVLFVVLTDGSLWWSDYATSTWARVTAENATKPLTCLAVAATVDVNGLPSAFVTTTTGALFYVSRMATGATWREAIPLTTGTFYAALGAASDGHGDSIAFGVTKTSQLTFVHQAGADGGWSLDPVATNATGNLIEGYTYTIDIALRDGYGCPVPGESMKLLSNEAGVFAVNGQTAYLDENEPYLAVSDAMGRVTVTYATTTLGAPMLTIDGSNTIGSGVTVTPSDPLQSVLETVTGDDLVTNLGIAPAGAGELASGIQASMNLANQLQHDFAKPGVAAAARAAFKPWRLSFDESGGVTYADLTPDDVAAHDALMTRTNDASSVLHWLSTFGDLVAVAAQNLFSKLSVTAKLIDDKLHLVVEFIYENVSYAFNQAMTAISQAFDAVSMFFAQIGAAFDKVVGWLGYLFDWADILRTKEAIKTLINTGAAAVGMIAPTLGSMVASGVTALKAQITDTFDTWISQANTTSLSTSSGATQGQLTPSQQQALNQQAGTNVVGDYVTRNGATLPPPVALVTPEGAATPGAEAFSALMAAVTNMGTAVGKTPAGQSAQSQFSSSASDQDGLLQAVLTTLLQQVKGVALAATDTAGDIAQAIIAAVGALVGQLTTMLNATWHIPFVSDLYKSISGGQPLTVLDVLALIVAIPATTIHKVILGAAPFATAAALTRFQAWLTPSWLAGVASPASGPAANTAIGAATPPGAEPPTDAEREALATLVGVVAMPVCFVYGAVALVLDVLPLGSPVPGPLEQLALLLEWAMFVVQCPWLTDATNSATIMPTDSTSFGNLAWLLTGAGPVIETATFITEGTVLKGGGGATATPATHVLECVVDAVLAALELVYTAIGAVWAKNEGSETDPLDIVGSIAVNVPGMARLVRIGCMIPPAVTPPQEAVLVVLGAAELAGACIAGVAALISAFPSKAPALPVAHALA